MDQKKLGKKIKLARVERDMTQIQLAQAIGTRQKDISRYEAGLAIPTLTIFEKLSQVLQKPSTYFLES